MTNKFARLLAPILCLTALFCVVALLEVFAALGSSPGDQHTDFDAALKAASWLGPALYTCSRNLSRLDARPVIMLVRVNPEGKADEVLARPLTRVARCLRPRILSAIHPKPPDPSWWIKLEVKIR